MTGRDLHKDWVGKTPLSAIPASVQRRVLFSQRPAPGELPICPECGQPVRVDVTPEFDHQIPLADGGAHAESNLRAIHPKCHRLKTAKEAHERAETRASQMAAYGLKSKSKLQGAGFRRSPPQHTATTPPKKRVGYFEEEQPS